MPRPAANPREKLLTPVQFLKGVGPQRAELLNRLGLKTAADLLFFFPRDYQDASRLVRIADAVDGELASVCGTVEEVDLHNTGPGRTYLGVLLRDESEYLRAVWFNQPWMRRRFFRGQRLVLTGVVNINGLRPEMHHPDVTQLADDEQPGDGQILPVYPLTEGLRQHHLRKIVGGVLAECDSLLEETFPEDYLAEHNLLPIQAAIRGIHFPEDEAHLQRARRRLVYQELLTLQAALALRKKSLAADYVAPRLTTTALIDARIRDRLPFDLTGDQQQAVQEITADMDREVPMNRLLHGEVGSGKTAVAVYAMLVAVAGGHQAAVMAPTEILAQQHWQTLGALLNPAATNVSAEIASPNAPSRVRLTLLTGGLTPAQRRDALATIAAGETDIVVGTHAVVSDDVQFANLGLVVIDEQHKFGVRQRAMLRRPSEQANAGNDPKNRLPHTLLMTATPIPRTVTMTLFGDLDVSTIRHAPAGRQPVKTYLVVAPSDEGAAGVAQPEPLAERISTSHEKWWQFFREKLRAGRQGYVIAPLVDAPGDLAASDEAASVAATFEHLANGELADFRLDVVHGRMSAAEKQTVMEAFRRGATDVLIATSVVEVGIDVPNATLMTILDGQRFGLAQLHQLRGRVSRGDYPGMACVFATTDNPQALRRLEAFAKSDDGFEIAELDFQLRGPGDLLGTRQHGLPPLRIADLQRDTALLEETRRDAWLLVDDHGQWHSPAFARLRAMVQRRYGKSLELGDVG